MSQDQPSTENPSPQTQGPTTGPASSVPVESGVIEAGPTSALPSAETVDPSLHSVTINQLHDRVVAVEAELKVIGDRTLQELQRRADDAVSLSAQALAKARELEPRVGNIETYFEIVESKLSKLATTVYGDLKTWFERHTGNPLG